MIYENNRQAGESQQPGELGEVFFVYRLLGVVYAAGSKKKSKKKHTEHERVHFLCTTEPERMPYTHATRQKHTLNTRVCSFEYQWTREGGHTVDSNV